MPPMRRVGRATVRVAITRDAPQLVRSFARAACAPPGVTVRVATPSDGPALRCLEQRTPVAADGLVIAIDRGDEPLAATRLMDDVMTFVAEYGGEIVAVLCDAYVRRGSEGSRGNSSAAATSGSTPSIVGSSCSRR